jgi:hypothetical protein
MRRWKEDCRTANKLIEIYKVLLDSKYKTMIEMIIAGGWT